MEEKEKKFEEMTKELIENLGDKKSFADLMLDMLVQTGDKTAIALKERKNIDNTIKEICDVLIDLDSEDKITGEDIKGDAVIFLTDIRQKLEIYKDKLKGE